MLTRGQLGYEALSGDAPQQAKTHEFDQLVIQRNFQRKCYESLVKTANSTDLCPWARSVGLSSWRRGVARGRKGSVVASGDPVSTIIPDHGDKTVLQSHHRDRASIFKVIVVKKSMIFIDLQ